MRKMRVIWLAIVGMIVAACIPNGVDNVSLNSKAIPVIIRAEQIVEEGTKTIRNADKSVSWLGGEEINVICGADRAKFTSTNTDASAVVSFSGNLLEATVEAIKNSTSAYPVWGLYPYDENVESDGETYVTTTLPAAQTGVAGTFADDLFITLAKSDDFNLSFYNVCSGFKFTVTKAGITSITIQGKNDEYIAGKVKLSMGGDGKPKVDEVINGQKTITLTPEKSTFEVGKDYYFVTLPTPFTSGFTVTFNTPSETGTFNVSASVSFPRSKFVSKTNVDAAVVYGAMMGNISIPDANFKSYCIENFDTGGDNEISFEEALSVLTIKCENRNIESLEGIEFFSNLDSLECSCNALGKLDISHNPSLTYLECRETAITSLNVNNNSELLELICYSNPLTVLDVSNCPSLLKLDCAYTNLSSIDVSKNTLLTYLDCSDISLESLDVSKNAALSCIICNYNNLSSLDVSNHSSLTELICYRNELTSLNVTGCTALSTLSCGENLLSTLDVSGCVALTEFHCGDNQLTNLIAQGCTNLSKLYCYNNPIADIDIRDCTAIDTLVFTPFPSNTNSSTSLNSINMSGCTSLKYFWCSESDLTTLNASGCTALKTLHCHHNKISNLDVTGCTSLETINCNNNALTSLDVSNCHSLSTLNCSANQITSLDISENTSLLNLDCSNNQLVTLVVSGCTGLLWMSCNTNKLTSLDVSDSTSLIGLNCDENPFLSELWLKTGQTIALLTYDTDITTIKYK